MILSSETLVPRGLSVPRPAAVHRRRSSGGAPRSCALLALPLLAACADLSPDRRASLAADDLPRLSAPTEARPDPFEQFPAAEESPGARPLERGIAALQSTAPTSPATSPAARPAEEAFRAKEGFYVGAWLAYCSLAGDFDGETALVGPTFAIALPEVDPGIGAQFSAGYRFESNAFEVSYLTSSLDGEVLDTFPLNVDMWSINLDWKHYFRIEDRLQPYFLLGLNFEEVTVKDGAIDSGGMVGNGTLDGLGVDLGGGLAYYFTPQLSVSLQGIYRLDWFFSADGPGGDSETIDSPLSGDGFTFGLGAAFTF